MVSLCAGISIFLNMNEMCTSIANCVFFLLNCVFMFFMHSFSFGMLVFFVY